LLSEHLNWLNESSADVALESLANFVTGFGLSSSGSPVHYQWGLSRADEQLKYLIVKYSLNNVVNVTQHTSKTFFF
jgi:hypothetical protein